MLPIGALQRKANSVSAWVRGKQDQGVTVTEDAMWDHIKKRFPHLSEKEQEIIFERIRV